MPLRRANKGGRQGNTPNRSFGRVLRRPRRNHQRPDFPQRHLPFVVDDPPHIRVLFRESARHDPRLKPEQRALGPHGIRCPVLCGTLIPSIVRCIESPSALFLRMSSIAESAGGFTALPSARSANRCAISFGVLTPSPYLTELSIATLVSRR